MREWISIEDDLPQGGTYVWVIHKDLFPYHPIQCVFFRGRFELGPHCHFLPSTIALEITHWIALPEEPQ